MNLPSKPLRVALVQTSAGLDVAANLSRIAELLKTVPRADVIALPEVFALRGGHADYQRQAEPVGGALTQWLAALARARRAWILAGSVIERAPDGLYNTSLMLNPKGRVVARYRKLHLFEAEIEEGQIIRERDTYNAGSEPVMSNIEGWRCGLAVCYDLRFPELFRHYSANGACLLFVPSNFTQRTGRNHWEILVRARAIENQSFVVAPDQCGVNRATRVRSYGHSLAVGPWGEVLCRGGNAEGVLSAVLDPGELRRTRRRIPALEHRRL